MSVNKKVRNTRAIVYDNISFKSTLECNCYKKLKAAGFDAVYEKCTYVLLPSSKLKFVKLFTPNKKKSLSLHGSYRAMTYTPDFEFEYKGVTVLYDAKGKPNDTYPLKKKLFLHYLESIGKPYIFFEPHNLKQVEESIQIILDELSTEDDEASRSMPEPRRFE